MYISVDSKRVRVNRIKSQSIKNSFDSYYELWKAIPVEITSDVYVILGYSMGVLRPISDGSGTLSICLRFSSSRSDTATSGDVLAQPAIALPSRS